MVTSIQEALALTSIGFEAVAQNLRSGFPDAITVIANWGMSYKNQIIIGSGNTTTGLKSPYVPFGSIDMYPPPLKGNSDSNNIIATIEPQINATDSELVNQNSLTGTITEPESVTEAQEAAEKYYCLALEIRMQKQTDSTGSFLEYSGFGAFTMAYNPFAASTGLYEPKVNYRYPTIGGAISLENTDGSSFYLRASLYNPTVGSFVFEDTAKNQTLLLTIELCTGLTDNKGILTLFQHVFTGVETGSQIGEGKISGLIQKVNPPENNSTMAGVLNNVQIITSNDEKLLYYINDSEVNASGARNVFIETYAFNYDNFYSNYILPLGTKRIGAV